MKKIYVRIARGKTNTTFHRAGMTFTKEWLAVGVDEATASCLYAEQMLEVTDVDPEPVEGLSGSTGSPRTVEGQTVAQDALDTAKKKGKG